MAEQALPRETNLSLLATGIEDAEIDAAAEHLHAEGIDAAKALYTAKGVEVPVQLFISAGIGYLATIFKKYLDRRVELEAEKHHTTAVDKLAEAALDRMAQDFARTIFEYLPATSRSGQGHVSIGISKHGPWGVHLMLHVDNKRESIDRIAWLMRNVGEVEEVLATVEASGRKAFGNYELIVLDDQAFALDWIEFAPAHRYRALKRLGMRVVITNQTANRTEIAPA